MTSYFHAMAEYNYVTLRHMGLFFHNCAIAGALMAAEDRGYESGYRTGYDLGYTSGWGQATLNAHWADWDIS